jgi:hypothetical protein
LGKKGIKAKKVSEQFEWEAIDVPHRWVKFIYFWKAFSHDPPSIHPFHSIHSFISFVTNIVDAFKCLWLGII